MCTDQERGDKKNQGDNWGEQKREKKSVTTKWSLTTYDSSLASAHPAYTPGSFMGTYTHTIPGGRGTELDFGKPCFHSLVPSGCCCIAAGQADGPCSSPFSLLSFLFLLIRSPHWSTHQQLPLPARWQIATPSVCACVSEYSIKKKYLGDAGVEKRLDSKSMWTNGTMLERQNKKEKEAKGFDLCWRVG